MRSSRVLSLSFKIDGPDYDMSSIHAKIHKIMDFKNNGKLTTFLNIPIPLILISRLKVKLLQSFAKSLLLDFLNLPFITDSLFLFFLHVLFLVTTGVSRRSSLTRSLNGFHCEFPTRGLRFSLLQSDSRDSNKLRRVDFVFWVIQRKFY